jgi:hypothetical protein
MLVHQLRGARVPPLRLGHSPALFSCPRQPREVAPERAAWGTQGYNPQEVLKNPSMVCLNSRITSSSSRSRLACPRRIIGAGTGAFHTQRIQLLPRNCTRLRSLFYIGLTSIGEGVGALYRCEITGPGSPHPLGRGAAEGTFCTLSRPALIHQLRRRGLLGNSESFEGNEKAGAFILRP